MLRTLITLTCLLLAMASPAATVKPIPLEQMAKTAAVIFYGRAVSNEVKLDELSQRVATFTTFEVIDAIKGITTSSYTIKQVGGQLPGSRVVSRIYGVPRFTAGEEYVVFLPETSRLGFASPMGLSQGSYHVNNDKTVNHGNATSTLANRSVTAPGASNKLALDDFLNSIRVMGGY